MLSSDLRREMRRLPSAKMLQRGKDKIRHISPVTAVERKLPFIVSNAYSHEIDEVGPCNKDFHIHFILLPRSSSIRNPCS